MCPPFCCMTHLRRCHHSLMVAVYMRLSVTPHCISSLQEAQSFLLLRQTVNGLYLAVFPYTADVDLFSNLTRLDLLKILHWNSCSCRQKRNTDCLFSPGGATFCYKFDDVRVNRCVVNRMDSKCVKNRANCFRRFEDVSNQTLWVASRSTWPRFWCTL